MEIYVPKYNQQIQLLDGFTLKNSQTVICGSKAGMVIQNAKCWPRRPDIKLSRASSTEVYSLTHPTTNSRFQFVEPFFSSFHKLVAVIAQIRRFFYNSCKANFIIEDRLTSLEFIYSKTKFILLPQSQSFHSEIYHLTHGKPTGIKSSILSLYPFIDQDG